MYTGILQMRDLTFILVHNNYVLFAVSYENNANKLVAIMQSLNLSKLILVLHPNINNENLVHISEWDNNKLSFGISFKDLKGINNLFNLSKAKEGIVVNALDSFDGLTRIPNYNTILRWSNSYAFVSSFNNCITSFEIEKHLDVLLDKYRNSIMLSNESAIIDLVRIKSINPELEYLEKSELLLIGTLLNASKSSKILKLPIKEEIPIQPKSNIDIPVKEKLNPKEEDSIASDDNIKIENNPVKNNSSFVLEENDNANIPVKERKKLNIGSKLCTIGICCFSLLIGSAVGTRAIAKHIDALNSEVSLVSKEIETANSNIDFYDNVIKNITGQNEALYKVYNEIKSLNINGMLYSFDANSQNIVLIYYLLDDASLNVITDTLGQKYTIQSTTKTDILSVQDKPVNVYTITLLNN